MKNKHFLPSVLLFVTVILLSACHNRSVDLWNGKDFSGWHFVLQDSSITPGENWKIQDGVIHCNGKTNGYMRTEKTYENYELTIEWRWPEKPGNSGVLLNMQGPDKVWPNCLECQLHAGDAGDFVVIGPGSILVRDSLYDNRDQVYVIIPKMNASSEKPAGEWNRYRIINTPDSVVCYVNGVLQNKGYHPSLKKGHILLQSEGAPVEFRNIRLKPLK